MLALDISAEQRAHRLHILALASSDEEWRALEGILKNKAYAGRLFRAYLEACTEKVRRLPGTASYISSISDALLLM